MVFVLAMRIVWILGLDKFTAGFSQWLLGDGNRSDIWRLLLGRRTPSWLGVVATALALGLAIFLGGRLLVETAVTVVVVGALLLLMGIRTLAAPGVQHFTCATVIFALNWL